MANKPLSTKVFMQSILNKMDAQTQIMKEQELREQIERKRSHQPTSAIVESSIIRKLTASRRTVQAHNLKVALLSEAMMKIYTGGINDGLKESSTTDTIMRNIVSTYIDEHGTEPILRRMHGASATLSEMANLIDTTFKKIMEGMAIDDPNAPPVDEPVVISQDMKDDFFKSINGLDTDSIEQAIKDRVALSVSEFINKNAEDKADIEEIMTKTKEKLDTVAPDANGIKESYSHIGTRAINKVRSKKQNVFGAMVTNVAESTMFNTELQTEFMESTGHLNVEKIIEHTAIMYTFMEMLNTTRLESVNEEYIMEVLTSLKPAK